MAAATPVERTTEDVRKAAPPEVLTVTLRRPTASPVSLSPLSVCLMLIVGGTFTFCLPLWTMLLSSYRDERDTLFPLPCNYRTICYHVSNCLVGALDWLASLVLDTTPRLAASLFTLHVSFCLGYVGLVHTGIWKPKARTR